MSRTLSSRPTPTEETRESIADAHLLNCEHPLIKLVTNKQLKTAPFFTFYGIGRLALQYRPYCSAKRPILHPKTAHIAPQNATWRNPLRAKALANACRFNTFNTRFVKI